MTLVSPDEKHGAYINELEILEFWVDVGTHAMMEIARC